VEFLSYGRQWIEDDDMQAVRAALGGERLTQGTLVEDFERRICEVTGARYCATVSNGTAALQLAVQALDLGEGRNGITSPITFVASANCLIHGGLTPKFADIDPETFNLSTAAMESQIDEKTAVVIPVHFAGQPAEMKRIHAATSRRGIRIIEDAAHAIGARDEDGVPIGACRHSDLCIFSFHPVKIVTTGEGGAITTNSEELFGRITRLRAHGITRDPRLMSQNPGPWYYEMLELGANHRLTDIQSALGISQLGKLERFIERRRTIARRYDDAFRNIEALTIPWEREGIRSAYHLYVLRIDYEKIGIPRKEVMEELNRRKIGTQVHYIPIYKQPYYRKRFAFRDEDYPCAEAYYERTLTLPLYPKMSDADVDRVIREVMSVCRA
jgi:UDP-4-amino-4,6-dideoxy-N-acetyl-beta-L-altrosamine transaminase